MTQRGAFRRYVTNDRLILAGRTVAVATALCGILSVLIFMMAGLEDSSMADRLQELAGTLIVPVIVLVAIPRAPRNGSIWAFAVVGLSLGFDVLGNTVAEVVVGISSEDINAFTVDAAPSDLPLAASIGLQMAMSMWIPSFVLLPTLVLLLFPNGRFPAPERRWRWIGILTLSTMSIGLITTLWQYRPWGSESYAVVAENESVAGIVAGTVTTFFILLAVAAIVGYVVKWRRARGAIRLQYRWVGFAFFFFATYSLVQIALGHGVDSYIFDIVSWLAILFIPVAYTVAILKYRLYGIDVVISKTVTYGLLALFITAVYALLVVGVGSLLGGSDETSLTLSIAAVAIVAVAFEPLRNRVQQWANRLVFGERATPYEVLSQATARLAGTSNPEQALSNVAQLVADGTGASGVVIWLRVGRNLQPHAAAPPEALTGLVPIRMNPDEVPAIPGDTSTFAYHRGETLGALSITKSRGQTVTSADEKVLADVAAGLGLLLRNIGLNAELAERAEQLRRSRRRLVAAHDAERHRLERDLHDGAQQQVVALKVKLAIAKTLSEREDANNVGTTIAALVGDTQNVVDAMRSVAHGIYPPLLESEGLRAALGALARTASVPIDVQVTDLTRYDRPVEETLYFCILEVVNHAIDTGATQIAIALAAQSHDVTFIVTHDGTASDLIAVEDRIDASSGTITVNRDAQRVIVSGQVPTTQPLPSSDRPATTRDPISSKKTGGLLAARQVLS